MKWKHFPRYWPFLRGIHRSPVNSRHQGQWRGALMFSLICVWINGWVNKREAGDLRRHCTHYDVIVMMRQGYFTDTRAIAWLPKCHSTNPKDMRWFNLYRTRTVKVKPSMVVMGSIVYTVYLLRETVLAMYNIYLNFIQATNAVSIFNR